ncbi:hypothetical protein [Chroococcus sp. FPU101]|uniref:hypothetical protein n=1 Tax=Chroococcus sp. FPU101 TaxID=1974212 RepID=UPI001A8F107D|nr:hypothetical protein [Chroococcus sp. FPU101]
MENKLEVDYNTSISPYIDIEIDGVGDKHGTTYRVWCDHHCLGTFYRLPMDNKWYATPFYSSDKFVATTEAKSFSTHHKAQAHIVSCWKSVE